MKAPIWLVLKGLQGILAMDELMDFIEMTGPSRILLCGSAKEWTHAACGYPLFTEELSGGIVSLGFDDATAAVVSAQVRDALAEADALFEYYGCSPTGWFPLTKVRIFERAPAA